MILLPGSVLGNTSFIDFSILSTHPKSIVKIFGCDGSLFTGTVSLDRDE